MSIFEYLNLRSEFEDLARHFVGVNQNGTVDSLKEFKSKGAKKNRFRDGYDRAIEIANEVTRKSA
jgi:hypothetical protein